MNPRQTYSDRIKSNGLYGEPRLLIKKAIHTFVKGKISLD